MNTLAYTKNSIVYGPSFILRTSIYVSIVWVYIYPVIYFSMQKAPIKVA